MSATRRSFLGAACAAAIAPTGAIALPGTAAAAAPAAGPDAALVRLCERIVALHREQRIISAADPWAPDRGPNHARYEAIWQEMDAASDAVYDFDAPTTPAGALAVSRAALALTTRNRDGTPLAADVGACLMVLLAQFHAGPEFEAEQVKLVQDDNGWEAPV